MNKIFIKQVKTKLKNVNYYIIAAFLCCISFTPLIHTFLPKKIDRLYTYSDIELKEGINNFKGVEIEVNNGQILKIRKVESKVINKVFGWSNWRRFLYGGSPYFCLIALTIFCFWVYKNKEKDNIHYRRTVRVVLSFFSFVSIWFCIYSLVPKNDLSYYNYYMLLIGGSIFINFGFYFYIKWKSKKLYSTAQMKSKIQDLTKYIAIDIYRKYIQKVDQKQYLIDTLKEVNKLNYTRKEL